MKTVIAIIGYDRCGKDTVAEYIKDFTIDSKIIRFGDVLKKIVSECLDIKLDKLEKYKNKDKKIRVHKKKKTMRDVLVDVSNVLKNELKENVLTERTIKDILLSDSKIIIIPDLRFGKELFSLLRLEKDKKIKLITVFLVSNLDECGMNKKKYEIVDIKDYIISHNVTNTKIYITDHETIENKVINFLKVKLNKLIYD